MKPTVVLVHGAFAESSSWNRVVDSLLSHGHPVVGVANPLRGVAQDAAAVSDVVLAIDRPVILVGHSYGGAVITNVERSAADIRALVYVAGFAPDVGESCADLLSMQPGSTLGPSLQFVEHRENSADIYIAQDQFQEQFCADLPTREAELLAVTQRPCTESALNDPTGRDPLWRGIPSWFIYGDEDRTIPAPAHALMAERAGSRFTLLITGGSHAVGMAHPHRTAELILEASKCTDLLDPDRD